MSNRPKRSEATPVKAALTIADTATQEALLVSLLEHFPDVRLEAEEDTPSVHRFTGGGDGLVVIDPIDGTLRFYLEGLGPYGVMVGLAIGDVYRAALVALPREELYLDAVSGGGARCARGDVPPGPVRVEPSGNRIFVSHDLPEASAQVLRKRGFEPVPASGGAISVAPLVPGVRGGMRWVHDPATGVSVRGRIGALIATEAGATVLGASGAPFPIDIRAPERALLVAADDEALTALKTAALL